MTDRYAIIKYKEHLRHPGKNKPHDNVQGPKPNIGDALIIKADTGPQLPDLGGTPDLSSVPMALTYKDAPIMDRPLSSVDTTLMHLTVGRNPIPPAGLSRTQSVYPADDLLYEPPLPKFEKGKAHTICEWCSQEVSRSLIDEKGWSKNGKLVLSSAAV